MRLVPSKSVTFVPIIFTIIGLAIMIVGASTAMIPLSGISFAVGPFSASVYGISASSAMVMFTGLVVFIVGATSMAMMMRRH